MKLKIWLSRALFFAYTAFIIALSLTPAQQLPEVRLWDKAEHAAAYGIMFLLGVFAYQQRILLIAIVCIVIGAGVELGQGFSPGRYPSLWDIIANTIGVAFGLFAYQYKKFTSSSPQ